MLQPIYYKSHIVYITTNHFGLQSGRCQLFWQSYIMVKPHHHNMIELHFQWEKAYGNFIVHILHPIKKSCGKVEKYLNLLCRH